MLTSTLIWYKHRNAYTSQLYHITNCTSLLYDSDSLNCRFLELVTFKSPKKYACNIALQHIIIFFRAATYSIKHTVSTKDTLPLTSQNYFADIHKCQFLPLLPAWEFLCPEGKGTQENNFNVNHGLSRALKNNNGEVINCEIPTFLAPTRLIKFLPLSEAGIGENLTIKISLAIEKQSKKLSLELGKRQRQPRGRLETLSGPFYEIKCGKTYTL